MQLKWLEDLLALAESGTLAKAAQQRHVTHPAFGRRIRALEAWAGTPLIDRGATTLRFTPEGQAMLEAAREALAALAGACRRPAGEADDQPLRIATGRTLARTLFATWYARMAPRIGSRPVQVSTRVVQETAGLLENGAADFMLTYFHPVLALRLDPRRFTHLRLADEALWPVSAPDDQGRALHALSRRRVSPWLPYTTSLALGRLLEDHLHSQLKPPRLRAAIECDSADAAHEFALRGFGIAWLPRSMVAADCRAGRLHKLGERSDEIRLEVRLYRPRRRLPDWVEALWEASAIMASE
jgi:LysR family transcriptional regulator, hypochlorite-specific transcription factor HypT